MSADQFNWKEMAQLIGGIALVALIQAASLFRAARLLDTWVIMAVFGVVYAMIGGVTWIMFEKRRRGTTT